MENDIKDQYDFVIGSLQVCIGILKQMKVEDKSKYPMQVGLLTEMIDSFSELRDEIKSQIETPVN